MHLSTSRELWKHYLPKPVEHLPCYKATPFSHRQETLLTLRNTNIYELFTRTYYSTPSWNMFSYYISGCILNSTGMNRLHTDQPAYRERSKIETHCSHPVHCTSVYCIRTQNCLNTVCVKQSTEQSSRHDLRPQIFRLALRPAIMFRAITPTPSMKKCPFYRRFSSERPANCSAFVSF